MEQLRAGMLERLRAVRNADGGWAYSPGKRSRIEPTCWALLALGQDEPQAPSSVLGRWPRQEGWLVDVAAAPVNHAFNAIAALTLLQQEQTAALAEPVIAQLMASRGRRFAPSSTSRQDNSLQAWSWVDGTFSWVEPTAWCLLVLKQRVARRALPEAGERIDVGERMLIDRACRAGGWNYGNSNVFGQDLPPHAPTTALALMALHDRRDASVVVRGVQWLQHTGIRERSLVALSLSVISLRLLGFDAGAHEGALVDLLSARPLAEMHDVLGMAMALGALGDGAKGAFALTPAA
jgi:hypothetical protein